MGSFSKLLGVSRIELIQPLERVPRRIYDGRIWGDRGLFQVAFDVQGMEALEEACKKLFYREKPFANALAEFEMANGMNLHVKR